MTEEIMESTLDSTPLSASESRKSTKPIMEKKRRARINASLTELKSLLLEVMKKEGTRHHKMEKADILEMTVKHLRMFQRQSFTAVSQDPAVANKYSSGFNECAGEVSRYLATTDGMEPELRTRLLNHLANCIQANNNNANNTQTTTVNSTVGTPVTAHVRPIQVQASVITTPGRLSPNSQVPKLTAVVPEINNNTVISSMQSFMPITATPIISQQNTNANVVSGLQVIPSRLANGEIAFVIPSNCLNTGQIPVIPLYNASTAQTSPVSPTSPLSQMGESVSPCSSVSSLASPPPPVVIQPTIIAQAAQTPIMVPVTSSSTSAAPVTEATSPDSSTPTTPPNNTNTHQVITSSRQVASSPVQVMASPVAPSLIDCTFKPPAIASPQPIDFTKRAPEIQRANEVEVKADEEYKLNPLPPHQMAPSRDENMWRPW